MTKSKLGEPQLNQLGQDSKFLSDIEMDKYLKKTKKFEEVNVVFFGSDNFSALVLEELIKDFQQKINKRIIIQTVVASPNSPTVKEIAKANSITILEPEKLGSDFINFHFSLLVSDVFIVASFGKIIPESLLNIPKFGSLNIHPSLLPKYRGPSPVPQTILNGDKTTGVTIIKMDEKMDHGPILAQRRLDIYDRDNYLTLGNKLFLAGEKLLVEILDKYLENKLPFISQNDKDAIYCQLIKKQDGYFEIDSPPSAGKLDRMIRAYYPWPGVWTKWRVKNQESGVKEKIVKFLPNTSLTTHHSSPFLVQMEGKKATDLKSFLNGYPDFPIKVL